MTNLEIWLATNEAILTGNANDLIQITRLPETDEEKLTILRQQIRHISKFEKYLDAIENWIPDYYTVIIDSFNYDILRDLIYNFQCIFYSKKISNEERFNILLQINIDIAELFEFVG